VYGVATAWQAFVEVEVSRNELVALDAVDAFTRYGADSDEVRNALARVRDAQIVRDVYVDVDSRLQAVGA